MELLDPIYIPGLCNFAYQLRWGISVFWRQPVPELLWLEEFEQALILDDIRILSWRWHTKDVVQFAVSTLPSISPLFVVQRVKGRLQYAVRKHEPKALRPHYAIRSYGTQEREIIEAYIAKQPSKHPMATSRSQQIFEELVFVDSSVDLSLRQKTTHGDYWYNLHIVLVHEDRWRDVNRNRLKQTQRVILSCAAKKGMRLSRCAILADHFHIALGCNLEQSPEQVTLAMMNNIAWIYEMKPILCFSAFIGTFGEYDQRAVQGQPSH